MDNNILYKQCFSCIDLTSLNTTDNDAEISKMTDKINRFADAFPHLPSIAAICVYPRFAATVKRALKVGGVKIAAVAGGFPSSQTFIDIKIAECRAAVDAGADELDVVISVGDFLAGEYDKVGDEIAAIKHAVGKVHLKAILETGALKTEASIIKASLLSAEAGADVIKTSTGKSEPAATPEAFRAMAEAVKQYREKTGKQVGLKAAGGIVTPEDALTYCEIAACGLGSDNVGADYFRIGASRLANNLLSAIEGKPVVWF